MALSREKILDTAFDVLCQFGLADLSMRRLATELGVAPGALYYHMKNKQELLASLASRILATVEVSKVPESQGSLLITGEHIYRQLISVKECSEVIRLALALHPAALTPDRLALLDLLEAGFLSAASSSQSPPLAAEIFMHTCLSLIEQEQTRALLAGSTPPAEPPASYSAALAAVIRGFTA